MDQEFDNVKTRQGNNVCSEKIAGEEHSLMSRRKKIILSAGGVTS
jgi:hypothetical protein